MLDNSDVGAFEIECKADDLELLEELEDTLAAREALEEYEAGETISLEELIAELEKGTSGIPD